MIDSKIQWTDATFNPWRGCQKVTAGCANCYAETGSKRNPLVLGMWGPQGTRVVAHERQWAAIRKLNAVAANRGERKRVFCASWADVFEDWTGLMSDSDGDVLHVCNVCGAWRTMAKMCHGPTAHLPLTMQDVRVQLFALIDSCPALDFQLVTKRPENIARMMPLPKGADCDHKRQSCDDVGCTERVRPNVWLLTSVENQETADRRIPELLKVPAVVRGLSMEPLLGPVDLTRIRVDGGYTLNAFTGEMRGGITRDIFQIGRLGWVILGGESGHNARPCNVAWVRDIVRQCKAAGVACFVKQLGTAPTSGNGSLGGTIDLSLRKIKDKKGGDIAEFPADLQIREFPAVSA